MTSSEADRLALRMTLGHSARNARIGALVDGVITDEAALAESGKDYAESRVRLAQVHGRDDIVLLCAQLGELLRDGDETRRVLRQIRWLMIVLCGLVALRSH
jgi:hypothetical protein